MENAGDANSETAYKNTGAVEQDRPDQKTNVAPLKEQLDHQYQDPLNKQSDSGLAERGQNPEFAGESQGRNELDQDTNANLPDPVKRELERDKLRASRMDTTDTDQNTQNFNSGTHQNTNVQPGSNRRDPDGNNPEGENQDQDPGQRQKQNQGEKKDDDLAA